MQLLWSNPIYESKIPQYSQICFVDIPSNSLWNEILHFLLFRCDKEAQAVVGFNLFNVEANQKGDKLHWKISECNNWYKWSNAIISNSLIHKIQLDSNRFKGHCDKQFASIQCTDIY